MSYQFHKVTALVVDDNPPMLDLVKTLLNVLGVGTVLTARHGQEAFQLFITRHPDLVITDWMMKPMDGLTLTRKIRSDTLSPNPFVPIILMTGASEKKRVMEARDAGITEFLMKPFKVQELYRRIEHAIEKPRLQVKSDRYQGPDRRRGSADEYNGQRRRASDHGRASGVLHAALLSRKDTNL